MLRALWSDSDLRGAHVLPLEKVVGLEVREETAEQQMRVAPHPSPLPIGCGEGEIEMDIVSHDAREFFGLLLRKNGYVLEQLYSPLIVHTTPEHAELKEICQARVSITSTNPLTPSLSPLDGERVAGGRVRGGSGVITKHHAHHYFGFAETQWRLFLKGESESVAAVYDRRPPALTPRRYRSRFAG